MIIVLLVSTACKHNLTAAQFEPEGTTTFFRESNVAVPNDAIVHWTPIENERNRRGNGRETRCRDPLR